MTSVLTDLRLRAQKRAEWKKTRDEIAKLPVDIALDLDLYPGDATRIATRAVYG